MPLYANGKALILAQLESIASGERVSFVEVGRLTDEQFAEICRLKEEMEHDPPGSPILVYRGSHHYESRVIRDGYSINDLADQIEAALAADSTIAIERHLTAVVSVHLRADGYGSQVRDRVVLELTQRKPKAEVYSAIPKGDGGGPNKKGAP